jgi:predicted NAD-dependent protein-ADP-ribosyltransferase YbiA (DUF1768 family)
MESLSKTAKKQKEITIIHKHEGPYGLLSMKSNRGFSMDGNYFNTLLHYYYYYLASDSSTMQKTIMSIKSCEGLNIIYGHKQGYKSGNPEAHIVYYNWKRTVKILIRGLRERMNQNMDIRMMISTLSDFHIYYHAGTDVFLGCGFDRKGLNLLGILMMMMRDDIMCRNNDYSISLFRDVCRFMSSLEIRQPLTTRMRLNVIYESDDEEINE